MIKNSANQGRGEHPHVDKEYLQYPIANIIINYEKLDVFSFDQEGGNNVSTLPIFDIVQETLASEIRQNFENVQIGKGKIKLCSQATYLSVDDELTKTWDQ